jgi:hypothetical protein
MQWLAIPPPSPRQRALPNTDTLPPHALPFPTRPRIVTPVGDVVRDAETEFGPICHARAAKHPSIPPSVIPSGDLIQYVINKTQISQSSHDARVFCFLPPADSALCV